MKIVIEQYNHTITHEVPHNDVDLDEVLQMIEGLLKAIGYVFSGHLEIVDDSVEFSQVTTHYRDGTIEQE
jgi:hypothetical protein